MIIFKDKNSGAEMFTDAYDYKLIDDVVYEIDGKFTIQKDDLSGIDIGANASAEEEGETLEDGAVRGIDIVINMRLEKQEEMARYTLKQYQKTYIKGFMKTLNLPEDKEEKDALQKKIVGYLNKTLGTKWANFDDFDQYMGEGASSDPDKFPMLILSNFREDDTPYFIFFKHGMIEEKV